MLASYKIKDPLTKQELPITPSMLQSMLNLAKSARDTFIIHLIIGTFFYTMHSCKYTKTNSKPCTTIVTTDHISFKNKVLDPATNYQCDPTNNEEFCSLYFNVTDYVPGKDAD